MIHRCFLAFLIAVQVLSPLLLISAQPIQVRVSPSKLTAKPGDRILLTLCITNLGDREIEVKGFNLEIRSTRLYLIPLSFPFGKYYVPLDRPVKIRPGERVAIREIVEVPYINYQGDFDVKITVISDEGGAETHLEITLVPTLLSASIIMSYIIAVGLLLLGLYWLIKRLKSERWRRKIDSIDKMLKKRDKLIEILKTLEEKRHQGKMSYQEYLDLKKKYEEDLRSIHIKLRSALPGLELDIERLTLEINNLRNELEVLEGKLVKEMRDDGMRGRLEHIEDMIKLREKILSDMRERAKKIESYIQPDIS